MKYNIWERKADGLLVLRPESTELSTVYWTIVHTFEAEDRNDAVRQFKEMGGEP